MAKKLHYNGYVEKLSKRFALALDRIEAHHNFEFGDEFEIALCELLRRILPEQYGICRGYLICADGKRAGNDIIIYDRLRFPTLRLLERGRYDRREGIPVEAACAYIEAKHTMYLKGQDGQSFRKALQQVANAKSLPRERRPLEAIEPYFHLPRGTVVANLPLPPLRNPMFGAIIARRVAVKKNELPLQEGSKIVAELRKDKSTKPPPGPDLVIAGENCVLLPSCEARGYMHPFLWDRQNRLTPVVADGLAFGVGVCSLLYALDLIQLGRMPYPELIADALQIPFKRPV